MTRPKDEEGRILPPAHKRLDNASALEAAGIFALAKDARTASLTFARKLTLVRKVIDHVIDGDKIPKWVSAKDRDRPEDLVLLQYWRSAEAAVRKERSAP